MAQFVTDIPFEEFDLRLEVLFSLKLRHPKIGFDLETIWVPVVGQTYS